MKKSDIDDLKADFDKFLDENCGDSCDTTAQQEEDENIGVPLFVDVLNDKLLAPALSGVYLSRIDIKRVAEGIDESIPIKERAKMMKALFRHTAKKEYLRKAFDEFNKHINGRILIYTDLGEEFPASKSIFDENITKAKKIQKMFEQIIDDFEEIEATDEPMII
ncbi:MAG: hypothetical protein WC144_04840 [Sulfurimonas sp.]|jgi:hypothetical protein|nr:hypothetical protein [Sulfurimonadaceae bacterium]